MATAEIMPTVSEQKIQVIEDQQRSLLQRAQDLIIATAADYKVACDLVKGIAELKKMIGDDFKDSKSAAHKAWKTICDQEKKHLDAIAEPDRLLRNKISEYTTEQERVRRQQEEIERQKAQKVAEETRLQEAIKAERQGRTTEEVNQILDKPVMPAPVVVPKAMVPKVEGVSMVDTWEFEIADVNLIPREYLSVDESKIRKVVGALKGQTNIPGVIVRCVAKTRIGAGR